MRRSLIGLIIVLSACPKAPEPSAPSLTVSGIHDFGQLVPGTSKTLAVVLRNEGSTPIDVTAFDDLGGQSVFSAPRFKPVTVRPSSSEVVEVLFAPLELGTFQADFAAKFVGGEARTHFIGVGVARECVGLPDVKFGAVRIGETERLTVSLDNPSERDVTMSIGSLSPAEFTASLSGDVVIPAGESRELDLSFTPRDERAYSGQFSLKRDALCPFTTVQLGGEGVAQLLSCELLDFGYVTPGRSATRDVKVTNVASKPIDFDVSARVGPSVSQDYLLPAAHFTAPANGEVNVAVRFEPVMLGNRQAMLEISGMGSCALRGTGGGPVVEVTPAVLSAGQIPYFPAAATPFAVTRKLTLANTGPRPTPPDVRANLHVVRWEVVAKNATSPLSSLCIGEWNGSCANGLPPSYDPVLGIVGSTSLDVPVRITPHMANNDYAWDVTFFFDDADQPSVTVEVRARSVSMAPCNYALTPSGTLPFGRIPMQVRERDVVLRNLGVNPGEECLIDDLSLRGGAPSVFSLPGGPLHQRVLAPGEALTVTVRATPSGNLGNVGDLLELVISSPSQPVRQVQLTGETVQNCLAFEPASIDFGAVNPGCSSAARQVTLYEGCTGITLSGVSVVGAEFSSTQAAGSVTVTYQPTNVGADRGRVELVVQQNGQAVTYDVPLSGRTGTNTDRWMEPVKPKADIVMVLDDSSSMGPKQLELSRSMASFFSAASSVGADFQVALLTASPGSGGLIGSLVTPATPMLIPTLQSRVMVTNGTVPSHPAERVLEALTQNEQLLRADARLSVVVFTDSADDSTLGAGYLAARLAELRPKGAIAYSVMGPFQSTAPAGCLYDAPGRAAHQELTSKLDGIEEEICSSQTQWPLALQRLGVVSIRTPRWYLTGEPEPSTLAVSINGQPVAQGVWSYDPAKNAIEISPLFAPAPTDTLSVSYTAVCH